MNKLTTRLLLAATTLVVGVFLLQLFGPNPRIVVSPQTTYITAPLAADGLPDYASHYFDQQRLGLAKEDNAAIPFLEAMWPGEITPQHHALVCKELGMPVPQQDGLDEPFWYGIEWNEKGELSRQIAFHLLAARGITPPGPIESLEDYEAWQADWLANNEGETPWYDEQGQFIEAGDTYHQNPFVAAQQWSEECLDQSKEAPWTRAMLPSLAAFVDTHVEEYDLLHEAARRPGFYFPSPTLLEDPNVSFIELLLPEVQSMRNACRALSRRAMRRLGEGRHAQAWQDIEAMHRLAEHTPQETLIGQLVLIACHGIVQSCAEHLLAAPDLPPDVAKAMHRFYQSSQPRRHMANSIDLGERLFAISTILQLSGSRKSIDGDTLYGYNGFEQLAILRRASINWNIVLEEMNGWYDRIAKAMKTKDFTKRQQLLTQIENDVTTLQPKPSSLVGGVFSRGARSQLAADLFASYLLPAVSAANTAEDRHNAKLQLMQVAAALAVHRTRHGEYPESLDALTPELLKQPPTDAFLGKPLVYTKTEHGYLLVDVGANGIDDGGSNERVSSYKGYDLSDLENEKPVRDLLGEPAPPSPPLDFSEPIDPEAWQQTLTGSIPADADDWAIRLPLPEADWSMLTPPKDPPQEKKID